MIEIGDNVAFIKYKKSGLWRKGEVIEHAAHSSGVLTYVINCNGKEVKIATFSYIKEDKRNIKKIINSVDFILD